MAVTLDFFGAPVRTIRIPLGGRMVDARSLSASEMDALRRAIQRPGPVMRSNPVIGAMPLLIPDDWSPEYTSAQEQWVGKMKTAVVAASIGLTAPNGRVFDAASDKDTIEWCASVVPAMRSRLGEPEIAAAYENVCNLNDPMFSVDGKDLIEAAKKNLSGLPRETLVAVLQELLNSQMNTASPSAT